MLSGGGGVGCRVSCLVSKSAPDRLLMGTRVGAPHTMAPACSPPLRPSPRFRSQLHRAYTFISWASFVLRDVQASPVNNGT